MTPDISPFYVFKPLYKSVLWGGTRIAAFKGIPPQGDTIGESWEISSIPGHESLVETGEFAGMTISRLLSLHGREIMGERLYQRFGNEFPLLVKFIDSTSDLSIQVHPDSAMAHRLHGGNGKAESWYSIDPEPDSHLVAGFKTPVDAEAFGRMVANNSIMDCLGHFTTRRGDVFFLPPGRVHGIGRGNFVLEIQQASDITYRIYDFGRIDPSGKPRQLHISEAKEAVNFTDQPQTVTNVLPAPGENLNFVDCPYFTADIANIDGVWQCDLSQRDSFTILVCIRGELKVTARRADGSVANAIIRQGHTLLVAAFVDAITVEGCGELVSTYIR